MNRRLILKMGMVLLMGACLLKLMGAWQKQNVEKVNIEDYNDYDQMEQYFDDLYNQDVETIIEKPHYKQNNYLIDDIVKI